MTTVKHEVHFRHGRLSKKTLTRGRPKPKPVGRVPRVTKLMALAIKFDQMIKDGVVADQAELARLGYVSRARLTQIMNLLCLAPDIQESILFLSTVKSGRDPMTEHELRRVVSCVSWENQRAIFSSLSAWNS